MPSLKHKLKSLHPPADGELIMAALNLTRALKYIVLDVSKKQDAELENIKLLLKRRAKVDEKDSKNYTALCWAAYHGRVDVVNLLIDNGADINQKTDNGYTPLSLAKTSNYPAVVKILEEADALRQQHEAAERAVAEKIDAARIKYVCEPQLHRDMPAPKVLRLPPRAGMK